MNDATPPWMLKKGPTKEDFERRRADARIKDLQLAKEAEEEDQILTEDVVKELAMKRLLQEIEDSDPDLAARMILENPDGTLELLKETWEKAPPEVAALLEQNPFLVTALTWKHLSEVNRLKVIENEKLSPTVLHSEEITEVLSSKTKEYLASWQRLVNSGLAWNLAGHVGRQAHAFIEAGFLLYAPEPTTGKWGDGRGRNQALPGRPGTAVYVTAMMGETYLAWIEAVV